MLPWPPQGAPLPLVPHHQYSSPGFSHGLTRLKETENTVKTLNPHSNMETTAGVKRQNNKPEQAARIQKSRIGDLFMTDTDQWSEAPQSVSECMLRHGFIHIRGEGLYCNTTADHHSPQMENLTLTHFFKLVVVLFTPRTRPMFSQSANIAF